MQRAGTTVPSGVEAWMLGSAVDAFDSRTAVVSVYLVLERAIENASQQNQASWRAHRDRLSEEGAPEIALAAIDRLVPDAHHGGRTLCVIADGGGLVHTSAHAQDLGVDMVAVDALPRLT